MGLYYLSEKFTWVIVQDNPDKNWIIIIITKFKYYLEIVVENPDKNWNYHGLSRNSNITWDMWKQSR